MNLRALMSRKAEISMIRIRGFVGVMGSGKGFKCQKLKEQGYVQIDFADCLREMVWKMLDWRPKNEQEYDYFKKGFLVIPKYGRFDGRKMLQNIGNAMRKCDPDFWVNCWKDAVNTAISQGYTKICCSDVRYENEVEALKSMKWKADIGIEFCDYHSERYNAKDHHESELFAQKLLAQGYKDGDIIA